MTFQDDVLKLTGKIPEGRVCTYSQIARALGRPGAARAVGNALHRNTRPIEIPCHRVVLSDGRIGGYASGSDRKRELLLKEGVVIKNDRTDLNRFGFCFA